MVSEVSNWRAYRAENDGFLRVSAGHSGYLGRVHFAPISLMFTVVPQNFLLSASGINCPCSFFVACLKAFKLLALSLLS
jgi:hypothetical protein